MCTLRNDTLIIIHKLFLIAALSREDPLWREHLILERGTGLETERSTSLKCKLVCMYPYHTHITYHTHISHTTRPVFWETITISLIIIITLLAICTQTTPHPTQYLEAVKKIYDQYLSATSPSTVNVDDRVLKAVESRLANPPLNIFNEAQEQVRK